MRMIACYPGCCHAKSSLTFGARDKLRFAYFALLELDDIITLRELIQPNTPRMKDFLNRSRMENIGTFRGGCVVSTGGRPLFSVISV